MLKEGLAYLADAFQKAAEPKVVRAFPRQLVVWSGGERSTVDVPPRPRLDRVDTIDAFVRAAEAYAVEGESAIWVGADAAVLVIDDDDHRLDRVVLPLPTTETFQTLARLRKDQPWFEQKEFVRLLGVDLQAALPPHALLNQVRRVRFETGQVVTAAKERTRESMGREITAAVQAAEGEIPERVECVVRVHDVPLTNDVRFAIPCAVEVDPGVGRFRLTPYPDAIASVLGRSLDVIADAIRDGVGDASLVMRGGPGPETP